MLINLKDILALAEEKSCAVGAFNTPNLECITAVLNAAEKLQQPVILSHAELHEPVSPLETIGPIMVLLAKKASVPVCVHLDHGETLPYLQQALDMDFSSVMYDGSLLSYEENVSNTRKAVEMAQAYGASVEAEIGILGGREVGAESDIKIEDQYTDPLLAERFVDATGIDALAASFGTAHGIYKVTPKLDFERIRQIHDLVNIPLVMHGGSGCSDNDYRTAIQCGVRKINYYSYMAREGVQAVKQLLACEDVTFYHDLARKAERAMEQDVLRAMELFACTDSESI